MAQNEIKDALTNPLAWLSGAIGSITTVLAIAFLDPTGAVWSLVTLVTSNAMTYFSAFSIAGFTVLPEVSPELARTAQFFAIVLGVVVVAKILGQGWDRLKEQLVK